MKTPNAAVIEAVSPSRDVGLPISDGLAVRNVAHMESRDTMRLPRGGPYEATLVVVKKFYDGSSGGVAGHYAMCFVEFRAAGSRWRTGGVKIRAEEAPRIARDMLKGKPSKPSAKESPRVGGKTISIEDSELRGAPAEGYLIFVRHRKGTNGEWMRTRGVEVLETEKPALAALLQGLASAGES